MAGYKHHLTDVLLHRMHERLQEICEREHLYTVEVDAPSEKKISQQEYQAGRRGQRELNEINAGIIEEGFRPSSTTFETVKQKIRLAAEDAAARAKTEEESLGILSTRFKTQMIFSNYLTTT